MKIWSLFLLLSLTAPVLAQDGNYARVDNAVAALGTLPDLNLARIADTITLPFSDKLDKARAIYYWIANEIALDAKAIKSNDNRKNTPEIVIASRKATPAGFALLFQEMASLANIRCLTVDGYSKFNPDDIGEEPDEFNHTWNVVQLGNSPTEWYYVDVAKACGHLDVKGINFIKSFSSGYFFPDRKLFNLDHLPDNMAWQLGPGPRNLKGFIDIPVLGPAAYELGLKTMEPFTGSCKAKVNRSFSFKMQIDPSANLSQLEMMTGKSGKRTAPQNMAFTNEGGIVEFTCIFYDEDEFPLTILANGKELVSFNMVVTD
jgi:hypothetical protein